MISTVRPTQVHFDTSSMWVHLSDGRIIGIPLTWFPRLLHSTSEQRDQVCISSRGLHWKALDEDISIASLLAGQSDQTTTPRFKRIPYDSLNARQKDLFNFQKIAATLADCAYNCIKLADDWQRADFLAYHVNGKTTLKVQLKSRLTIHQKKYSGKDIWIAFPYEDYWYLIEHDRLVEKVGVHTKWLNSETCKNKGGYHSTSINPELLKSLTEDRLGPVYGHVHAV